MTRGWVASGMFLFQRLLARTLWKPICRLARNSGETRLVRYQLFFLQLVWKKTKQIGAAQAGWSNGRVVVVVRYSPAGNYDGKYKENVLPKLSGAGQTRCSFVFIGLVVITGAVFNTFI